MDIDFISNLGNSQADTEDVIDSATRIHWLEGLKKAENIILEKQNALLSNNLSHKKHKRELELLTDKLGIYRLFSFLKVPVFRIWIKNKIEDVEDSFQENEARLLASIRLVEDCKMELATALRKKQQIIEQYPEAKTLSYPQLQAIHSFVALRERKAFAVAATIWSAERNLPESVGHVILSAPPHEQEYLMLREVQIRTGAVINETVIELARWLAELPLEQQQKIMEVSGDARRQNNWCDQGKLG